MSDTPKTWEDLVKLGLPVPEWPMMSERNRRAVMARGSVVGYTVNYNTGKVTRKS